MDRTLIILLVALALVYLAWLSARRQVARQRQQQQEHVARHSCTLEPLETHDGHGFAVTGADGGRRDPATLAWGEDGLEVMPLENFRADAEAGGADSFAAGLNVELIDGDEADPLLWVWDRGMTARAGSIPAHRTRQVRQWLDDGVVGECIVVWEGLAAGRRTGLQVLLVHRDVDIA